MAEETVTEAGRDTGSLGRLVGKAAVVAALAGAAGLAMKGEQAALGGAVGALAAGVYVWSYLRSHLARAGRGYDRKLGREAAIRLAASGLAGAVMWSAGRPTFLGFLAGFGAGFALLIASEAPRVARSMRAAAAAEGSGR